MEEVLEELEFLFANASEGEERGRLQSAVTSRSYSAASAMINNTIRGVVQSFSSNSRRNVRSSVEDYLLSEADNDSV